MFRIIRDPSSGSIELYLTEICSGSPMFVVCLVGVWQRNFEPVVCVCVCTLWRSENCTVHMVRRSENYCVCVRYNGLRTYRTHTHTTGSKLRCQTWTKHTTNISEPLRIISVKYSSILPDDGSHTIWNMSKWFLILCLSKWFKITLPNTDQAHDKHQWTTTNNFSPVQLYTPWWWIAYDPKHVGVIFNFVSFKIFIQRRF